MITKVQFKRKISVIQRAGLSTNDPSRMYLFVHGGPTVSLLVWGMPVVQKFKRPSINGGNLMVECSNFRENLINQEKSSSPQILRLGSFTR